MVQIVSDNRKVTKLIEKIVDIVRLNGGHIAPDIEFHCADKNIAVRSPSNPDQRQIFSIPHELLVPYEAFQLGIKKDRLVIKKTNDGATKLHKELMRLMIKLYNETDKLAQHRATSPWLSDGTDLPVLDFLLKAREGSEYKSIREMVGKEDKREDLECLTFFKTRLLNCRLNKAYRKATPVLMPLVDFMNHDVTARGYDNIYGPKKGRLSIVYTPVAGSDECFVDYGAFDALDTYLHYGFINDDAPFMRSVPVKIDFGEDGKFIINATYAVPGPKNIPENLSDLAFYMPIIRRGTDKHFIRLSHIFIPGKNAPRSMRRIVRHAVCALKEGLGAEMQKNAIQQIESAILVANRDFYEKISKQAEGLENEDVFRLSQVQLDKIETYINEINKINQAVG